MAALECVNVTAGYDGVPVLRGVDLSVEQGEVVALLGPNGAGKTSLLNTITGLVRVISGTLRVLGEPVCYGRPHVMARRGVAHVPDDRSLFFGLTVRENLRLGCRRQSRSAVRGAIDSAVGYFPALEPLMDRNAGLLSGGEQQMLALARTLTNSPRVLMVDEMSLGLAPVIVQRLLPITREVARSTGAAVLLVEQHTDIALQVADRVYVLNRGEVVLTGTGAELRENPELLRASYLGELAYEQLDHASEG